MHAFSRHTDAGAPPDITLATTNKRSPDPIGQDPAGPLSNDPRAVEVPQYSKAGVLAVWAAAAVPMGALAWVIAPAIAGHDASRRHFFLSLFGALTFGLIWQACLVGVLMLRERSKDPTWTSLRDRLWLRSPSTATRRGGRLWWWIAAYGVGLVIIDMFLAWPAGPSSRDFGLFLNSAAGKATFHHAWGLYALVAVELAFNTFLGEEMLFRGVLLPRMRAAFGRADWVVNSVLFGCYHLHEPWVIPNGVLTGFVCAHPTRRFRSAWMGIAIHSIEAVFFLVVLLPVVAG